MGGLIGMGQRSYQGAMAGLMDAEETKAQFSEERAMMKDAQKQQMMDLIGTGQGMGGAYQKAQGGNVNSGQAAGAALAAAFSALI